MIPQHARVIGISPLNGWMLSRLHPHGAPDGGRMVEHCPIAAAVLYVSHDGYAVVAPVIAEGVAWERDDFDVVDLGSEDIVEVWHEHHAERIAVAARLHRRLDHQEGGAP